MKQIIKDHTSTALSQFGTIGDMNSIIIYHLYQTVFFAIQA